MNEIKILNHKFPAILPKDSQILILGSFPSVKSREDAFYYMHPQNRFWPLMSSLFGDDFVHTDIEGKRHLLQKHHIALYDVIESCRIEGSQDASITDVVPTNVEHLIKDTKIKRIFLNGRTAYNLFIKHNPTLKSMATYLPSTSPANARFSLDDLYRHWQIIKEN